MNTSNILFVGLYFALAVVVGITPLITIWVISRTLGRAFDKVLETVDRQVGRIVTYQSESQMLGGKPKDLILQELEVEQLRVQSEARRQEIALKETIEERRRQVQDERRAGPFARNPFSGIPQGDDEVEQ